MISLVKLILIN